ncbi:MAG: STAS domain-containing protein [Betaproteobacteria bacterium]|nr:STAS domain-containing protein [Betaproteobacteria bacterium]
MQLDIEKIQDGQGAIVTIRSENLDAGNVKAFKDRMIPVLEDHQSVLLDMSGLTFVDSSGLGALLSCLRTVNNKKGQLKLFAMAKPVQALFELVRMHRIFSIYNTRDEALAAL